jgi:glycosyltransferase involved in cell wall biosynthesis
MRFSVIIPVYNRPGEVDELLESLTHQDFSDFEVIIIEDGSSKPCNEVVNRYSSNLNLKYFFKDNTGPGLTRNFGANEAMASSNLFDSDCIILRLLFDG